jgi:hypothetical protein
MQDHFVNNKLKYSSFSIMTAAPTPNQKPLLLPGIAPHLFTHTSKLKKKPVNKQSAAFIGISQLSLTDFRQPPKCPTTPPPANLKV